MLADGLGGYLWIASTTWGLICTAVAILVEFIAFWLLLRRLSWRIGVLVIAANMASAFIGGLPRVFKDSLLHEDCTSDPWEISSHYWGDFLPTVLLLFAATCIVEFLCVLPLMRRDWGAFRPRRLLSATVAGNVLSYALLVFIIWRLPPQGAGDFQFVPDTHWVPPSTRRVFYVDPFTERLCSIRLDGSGQQFESNEKALRFDWFLDSMSIYAVDSAARRVLYVDERRRWWSREGGKEQLLGRDLPENCRMRHELMQELPALLTGRPAGASATAESLPGVFFSGGGHYWRRKASGEFGEVETHIIWAIRNRGVTVNSGGLKLHFGIKHRVREMFCRDPEVLDRERLVLFRCGGWIMVMDPVKRKVGRLVRGESMVIDTPYFSSTGW